ncbi:unnamed protein product [Dovyalis caffra]|uniref:Transcriptional regulator n=1 Tax=Dovyalis caffra TaxID=77055 RepID=A0AAV1SGU2_9ROSI|nr:unnamed protein product [Dovyalis caffra]
MSKEAKVCNESNLIRGAGSLSHETREAFLSALVSEELHGMDRTILMRVLKLLEHKGKLAIFKGTSADDEGVKFSV